jgi:F-type H+-transporting ATPase subunit epsilon
MELELLTLRGTQFKGEVAEVSLTTAKGQLGVLPHHEPLTAIVMAGPVTIKPKTGQPVYFAAFGGLLEVMPDRVRILADDAEPADEYVQAEVEAALKQAQQLKDKAKDKHELQHAQEMVDRHEVRLKVAKLRRRPRG